MLRGICYKLSDIILPQKSDISYVIVMLDGGICSQMYQYLLGQLYAEKNHSVSYDLTFYTKGGMDMDGVYARNFDLEKAFPYLRVDAATVKDICRYKKRYGCAGNHSGKNAGGYTFLNQSPPLYLGDYYGVPDEVFLPAFRKLYRPCPEVLDEPNERLYAQIVAQPDGVGVHVRRGDLKVESQAYGKPASKLYFERAIAYMRAKLNSPYFYFFSDEPEWVSDELIPQLDVAGSSQLVDLNGSDRGYMDLVLLAACKHQIASKGSLGKFAGLLAGDEAKIITFCDDPLEYRWKNLFHNPVYL